MKLPTSLLRCILMTALCAFSHLSNAQWNSGSTGISPDPPKGLYNIVAVNSQCAWALPYVRNHASIKPITGFTKTIDGGKHWIAGNVSEYPDQIVIGLSPLSETTAYMISFSAYTSVGKVLKTTDGGATWTELIASPDFPVFYQNIHFFNENDGVVYGDSALSTGPSFTVVFTTHDGGNTWLLVPDSNMAPREIWESFYPVSYTAIGDTIWTVSTFARVWRSTDQGEHWVASQTDRTEAVVSNIKMRDAMHGLWGIEDDLYRTSDGGITWQEINPAGTFFTFDLAYVPGTSSTWVSTGGDTSHNDYFTGALHGLGSSYSLDDGNSWITIDTGIDHLGLAMVNSYTGFCGGFNNKSGSSGVFTYSGSALGYACGNNLTKMCFNENSYCIPHKGIQLILNRGGALGECDAQRFAKTEQSNGLTCYPNPFSPDGSRSLTILFSLVQSEKVSLSIYDIDGRLIRILEQDEMSAGAHELTWDARDEKGNEMKEGMYLLQFIAGENLETKKLIVGN